METENSHVLSFAKKIWHSYLEKREYSFLLAHLDEACTWIGAGSDMLFPLPGKALTALDNADGQAEAFLKILREHYYPFLLENGLWLVTGFSTVSNSAGKKLLPVQIRFTFLLRQDDALEFKLQHFHFSIPSDNYKDRLFAPISVSPRSYDALIRQMGKKSRELEALANGVPGGVARFRLEGNCFSLLYANDGFFQLCGKTHAQYEAEGRTGMLKQITDPEDYEKLVRALRQTAGTSHTLSMELRLHRKKTLPSWVLLRASFLEIQDGYPVYQGILMELTEQKKTQQHLERANRELRQLANSIPGGVAAVRLDEGLSLMYANDRFYHLTGAYQPLQKQVGCRLETHVHPDDLPELKQLLCERISQSGIAHAECRIRTAKGNYLWKALNASKIDEQDGMPVILCVFMDITDLKTAQQALEIEKERYRIVASLSRDLLFEYDIRDDSFCYFNADTGMCRPIHCLRSFQDANSGKAFILPEDLPVFQQMSNEMQRGEGEFTVELRTTLLSEQYEWTRIQGKTIFDEVKIPVRVIGSISNIDAQKREIAGLIEKAQFDTLTGLYNRGTLESLIGQAILEKPNCQHAFLIADLDRFKTINDTLGHMTGDSVLTEVSGQLRAIMRNSDIVGRMGGDEFVIFIKNIPSVSAIRRKAQEICDLFRNTCIEQNRQPISGSVGIALYPKDGQNFDELFSKADCALYSAKRQGKDCYTLYSSEIEPFDNNQQGNEPEPESQQIEFRELLKSASDPGVTVQQLLAGAGRLFQLSRALVLEAAAGFLSVSHEWCGPLAPSARGNLQNIPTIDWQRYASPFLRGNVLICTDTRMLRIPESIRTLYARFSTRAQIQCLFGDLKKPKGAVCFDICDHVRVWSEPEIDSLVSLAKLIGARLLDSHLDRKNSDSLLLEAVARNPYLYSYAVQRQDFKLLYLDSGMQQLYPNAKPGDLCYQAFDAGGSPCHHCPLRPENGGISEYYNSRLGWWINTTSTQIAWMGSDQASLIFFTNITSFRRRILTTDALTGLSNMAEFETDALSLCKQSNRPGYALVYMDFNRFKYINETFGYHTGDQVLIVFSKALLSLIHPGELACRYTSDMFLALLQCNSKQELVSRLTIFQRDAADAVREAAQGMSVTLSGGISFVEPGCSCDFITIVDRANIARKSIKGTTTNRFAVYDSKLHEKTTREKEIELMMAAALKNHEFVVFLQPKIDLKTGKIAGAEALVRWHRSYGQMVMPSEFIPLFEKNSFIKQLDLYIHEQVFQLLRKWLDEGKPLVPISVNISRVDMLDDRFISLWEAIWKKYQLPPELIELELTESVFLDSTDELIESINRLRAQGLLFSIDDFGSGYSSLNLLRRLPIDVLKLDRDFLSSEHATKKEKAVISSVIHMAKSLDIVVLSEGVETEEQASFLRTAGCDFAQGFLYSRPLPVDSFLEKLAEQS